MDYTIKLLKKLITEQVKLVLLEQEELDLGGGDDAPADTGGDLGDLDLGGGDLDSEEGGEDLELGDDSGGDLDGDLGDGGELGDLEDDGDFVGDFGGGGGGFGGGGFGGGGGMDDMGGDDSESEGGDGEDAAEEEPEGQIPDDPNQGVVDDIKAALEQTQDVQPLLNVAKSSIQKYFDSFETSNEVVSLLQQEDNPVLQDVAKRLNMFLKGF